MGDADLPRAGKKSLQIGRQEAFARLIAQGLGNAAAYEAAGYTGDHVGGNSATLRKRPHVKERIDYLNNQVAEKAIQVAVTAALVTQNEVIDGLRENIAAAKQGTAILAKDGSPTGEFRRDFAAVNRGLESLGKSISLFIDVTREEDFDSELKGMDSAAVMELIATMIDQLDPNARKMFTEKLQKEAAAAKEAPSEMEDEPTPGPLRVLQ